MNAKTLLIPVLLVGAAALLLWLALGDRGGTARRDGTGGVGTPPTGAVTYTGDSAPAAVRDETAAALPIPDFAGKVEAEKIALLGAMIGELRRRFRESKPGPEAALTLLGSLDRAFAEAGVPASAAAIVAFLDSGEDAGTGLEFLVGEGGILDEAPTMRTALLDRLGQLSGEEAVRYAEKIFAEARSADEWTVSLRNLAWGNGENRFTGTIGRRLGEMLDRNDWLENPSAGFVEAFDLAVYLGGPEQVANMASVLNLGPDNGLDFAAFLSLDRLALRDPGMVFDFFAKDGSLMSWAPQVRASLMARAVDPGSEVQLRALEAYLANPGTGEEEFRHFADLYPLRSYTVGPRLATKDEEVPGLSETAQADLAALAQVRAWLGDPRFAARREGLKTIEARLLEFQGQIERARREGTLR